MYEHNLKHKVLNDRDLANNRTENKTKIINLKGFMVGNGVTNWEYDTSPALPDTLYGFDMIPTKLIAEYDGLSCHVNFHGEISGDDEIKCGELFTNISKAIPRGILNPYDLYRKVPDEE